MSGGERVSVLLTDIGVLVTNDPSAGADLLGTVRAAALAIEGGRVAWVGPARRAPDCDVRASAAGASVLPGFVDSHTHLVFAGDRLADFLGRMSGRPYDPDGIAATVAATRAAPDEVLEANVSRLLGELLAGGVTTVEIKSGYGLNVADEQRCLRVARRFTPETTFLGAHVVPAEHSADRAGYLELVTGPMLAAAVPHARWIDVFCDAGAFDAAEARAVCAAGQTAGLGVRVHGNQRQAGPGIQVAVEVGAASVDHCTHVTESDLAALSGSSTVATLLPGAEFSTRAPYPDARRLLRAGARLALATDCNPGSSFTTSMPFCIAVAVREMGLSPAEAIRAATVGGAQALRREDVGVLRVGARADLVLLDAPDPAYLAYRPGVALVREVWKGGRRLR